jgi:transcriptional regulator with XRE-family HTH domain
MRPAAHFYISMQTQGLVCAYTHRVDLKPLREALRRARQGRFTLDELAAKAGLDRATIHSIENVKREPNLQPELATVERLADALGLKLSLQITRQINAETEHGQASTAILAAGPRFAQGSEPEGADGTDSAVPAEGDRALAVRLSRILATAALAIDSPRRQIATTRSRKPKGARGNRRNRG